jgi:hypothetical protein
MALMSTKAARPLSYHDVHVLGGPSDPGAVHPGRPEAVERGAGEQEVGGLESILRNFISAKTFRINFHPQS